MAKTKTRDELVESLARVLGPWLAGTTTAGSTRSAVKDTALAGLELEEDAWAGARVRVLVSGTIGWEERPITALLAATSAMTIAPQLSATPEAGAEYQVFLPAGHDVFTWAINRAIEEARPEVYQYQVSTVTLTEAMVYNAPEYTDDVIGLEVESQLEGEGFQPVPVAYYSVEEDPGTGLVATVEDPSFKWIVLRRPLPEGQTLRVHGKRYYDALAAGTAETALDAGYVLPAAEAYLRRHLMGQVAGSLVRHHKELLVDAREVARAQKAALAAGLVGAPAPMLMKKR
jgi:hypothetical protein